MKTIVLASRNRGKIREIQAMLADLGIRLFSLNDYPEIPEIVEDGKSFLENALKKGRTVAEATGEIVLADDSGLEVDALGGAPGIHSARYAGADADDLRNNRKLLHDLKGVPAANRGAAFRCVLVLYPPDGRYEAFEGRWEGRIAEAPVGKGGFGYDPVFFLPGEGMTVAQLSPEAKNRVSHRAQAFAKLKERLRNGS
ncbi:MAG: XTP/dITP diphosphatase [Proteobacteria bacterium]|nr:XTP/dITP diphosphatase [Pseudomonadota bacterium]